MDDDDYHKLPPTTEEIRQEMISSLTNEITSSSRAVATHILEAHQWDIAAAVSAFKDAVAARPNVPNPRDSRTQSSNPLRVDIPASSSPPSPIRLRSPRPPSRARNPFSREAIQQDDDDFDDKENDDAMESDDVARDLPSSSSSLPREILSDVTPQVITRTITIWRNGFTLHDVDNNLYPLDDPECAQYLQGIESLDSPRVQDSPGGTRRAVLKLIRRQQEDFSVSFQGVGRTLSEPDSVLPPASSDSLPTTVATPTIDPTAPITTIKIILADCTPIVSRFNTHHTIRDVPDFIDAATPDAASRDYQLLIMGMGSRPAPLTTDLDQTIDQAGISNSVLTLKF